MKTTRHLSLMLLAAALTGCINNTGAYKPPVEELGKQDSMVREAESVQPVVVRPTIIREGRTEQQVQTPVATPVTVRKQNPAVIALLHNAQQQKNRGAMQAAQSSLERAQRIAPRDPEIYFQLADVRRLEGLWPQAEQLALKGTNMAIGDPIMLRRLWLLIADIRSQSGNPATARDARRKAMSY